MTYSPYIYPILTLQWRSSRLWVRCARELGVTLIEIMFVLAIVTIMSTMIQPIFDIIARNRVTTYTNAFVGAVSFARSAAIMRGRRVVMCKSSNPNATSPTCVTSGGWEQGWVIRASTTSGTVLRVHERLGGAGTLSLGDDDNDTLTFAPNGRLTGVVGEVVLNVCVTGNTLIKGAIVLTSTGRAMSDIDRATCP